MVLAMHTKREDYWFCEFNDYCDEWDCLRIGPICEECSREEWQPVDWPCQYAS